MRIPDHDFIPAIACDVEHVVDADGDEARLEAQIQVRDAKQIEVVP